MTTARCIVLAACVALILSRATGLHVHWSAEAPGHDHAGVEHHHADLVAAAAADHEDRHAGQGEVDIDLPDSTSGKLPTLPLLPALIAALLALVLLLPGGTTWAQRYRPPEPRRRVYLLPPPQGPPLAS